ncbi:MAG: hypothetical protein COV10_03630 [Candidatus Vogelbacteria bacterium CG10_big_fil_rev_8_21_14_0_10_51_16]|uniref:Uncharacterized protein n=1 Tax=Candidatus Vogelbacteria bacterium CG10_big_fil_rev_8_21_14_0_10_51_16 TaxID=1975045 RepID=A0A2H0RDH7_9BACT|nr:MAG: hypothetical protein COV10_03630 [Candidatus Vogelbacteria bacterium CG10_big_fil_rev_8_21_14_0_10_51_16]
MTGELPASYDALLAEEQASKHRLTVVVLEPEKMWAWWRYVFLCKIPLLERLPAHLDDKPAWTKLRGELSNDALVAQLRGLVRQFSTLPHLNRWRREELGEHHEGKELVAAIGVDIVGSYPEVNGKGMTLWWGPWPDHREVSGIISGYVALEGTYYPYGHQMAFWGMEGEERLLENFTPEKRRNVAIWEFRLGREPGEPFQIGIAGLDEVEALRETYRHVALSHCRPNLVAVYLPIDGAAEGFALRHQGDPPDAPLRVLLST